MAFRTLRPTVSATATAMYTAVAGDVEVWIQVPTGTSVYIGDSSVTTLGFPLGAGTQTYSFRSHVRPGDDIWAVTSSGSTPVDILVRSA